MNIDEVREELNKNFLKQPISKENTLMRDMLLAMINYCEKLGPEDMLLESVEVMAEATAAVFVNMCFRMFDVNTLTDAEDAILIFDHIQRSFKKELAQQSMSVALVQAEETLREGKANQ